MRNKTYLLLVLFFFSHFVQAQTLALTDVDQMPYFPGCDAHENGTTAKRSCSNDYLISFISNNLKYPKIAKEEGLQGTVYVSFVIDEKGVISNENVLKDVGGGCGEEALRVLSEMPLWEPAIEEGKKVRVQLNLPIRFSLKTSVKKTMAAKYKINWGQIRGQQVSKAILKENLGENLLVRNQFGNTLPLSQLTFSYEKGNRFFIAKSKGKINNDLAKIIKKCHKGGLFKIVAMVQEGGDMIEVIKELEVIAAK